MYRLAQIKAKIYLLAAGLVVVVVGVMTGQVGAAGDGGFAPPVARAKERVTKKPFGLFVSPKNSPIQPERFTGWHTGADYEIFPEEKNKGVAVSAVCSGALLRKQWVAGYGGVIVQACQYNGRPITVLYGHLKLGSVKQKAGQKLKVEERLGVLGAGKSRETNGERKHLHLAIHKGKKIDWRGYARRQSELKQWLNPALLFDQAARNSALPQSYQNDTIKALK